MGEVYRARHEGRDVAIKVVADPFRPATARFEREARVWRS
jgi:hypothetical protein